jgi:hypothetical protein
MNRLKTTRIAISALFISSTFAFVVPTQAQPMMGEMGIHHDGPRMHERMAKHWAQRQAELKNKAALNGCTRVCLECLCAKHKNACQRIGSTLRP